VRLQIVGAANACVGHDRRAAAGFVGRRSVPIATAATACRAVERVVGAELMSHLVDYVVNVESIAGRRGRTGNAARLATGYAHHAQTSNATHARAEHVTDVVVGVPDD